MITPTALQRHARRAILARLKGAADLLALVPAASIDPDGVPSWPFILVDAPTARGKWMACAKGADVSFDVHAFAEGNSEITGYDFASAIGTQIETVLAPNNITLEDGSTCKLSFSDVRILKDQTPDHWHWFGQLNCSVLKAVPA